MPMLWATVKESSGLLGCDREISLFTGRTYLGLGRSGLYAKTPDGKFYWAYGGDLAPKGTPSSANFCMNGLIAADRTLKPHIHEVKKVYQNIAFSLLDYHEGW